MKSTVKGPAMRPTEKGPTMQPTAKASRMQPAATASRMQPAAKASTMQRPSQYSKPARPARKAPGRSGAELYEVEHPDEFESVELVRCRKCGRSFARDRISKHQAVCKGPINEVPKPHPQVSDMHRHPPQKRQRGMPEWKKQHIDFINNVRYAKRLSCIERRGGDVRAVQAPQQMHDPTQHYKPCPYCGRKFNPDVAERHIPRCKDIINKPKPPPRTVINKCRLCGIQISTKMCPRCKR